MAGVAQLEPARIKERHKAAKEKGVYKGGAKRFSNADIRKMHADGMGATDIMRAIGARSTSTVYRAVNGSAQ